MGSLQERLPTTSYPLWGDAVEVACFGRKTGDWAFRGMDPTEAERGNPGILAKLDLLSIAYRCVILAPHATSFNARLVRPLELTTAWTPRLFRGAHADAVVLEAPHQAFAVASGDCPTLVLRDIRTGSTVAAHAGRDCLFDRANLIDGAEPRRHASVVDAMMDAMRNAGSDPDDVRGFIACGTGPGRFAHSFNDPVKGPANRRMVEHLVDRWGDRCVHGRPQDGRLALPEIIREQLRAHGVHPAHVGADAGGTQRERDADGGRIWHSHRRDGDGRRNLVLVVRKW